MLRALAWKELRELAPFAALALALEVLILIPALRIEVLPFVSPAYDTIPFVHDASVGYIVFVAITLAGVLGLWQTMWENHRNTFQFLLHRPAHRGWLIAGKLLVGVVTVLATAALPLGCYTLWASTPGTHASPFEWSMPAWCWQMWAMLPLVYLGAFLSGLRPARLYATRFFPLAAALFGLLVNYLLTKLALDLCVWPAAVGFGVVLLVGTYLAFGLCILHVAVTRDYS